MPFAPLKTDALMLYPAESQDLLRQLDLCAKAAGTSGMDVQFIDVEFAFIAGARAVALGCALRHVSGAPDRATGCQRALAIARPHLQPLRPFEDNHCRLDLINTELSYKSNVQAEQALSVGFWHRLAIEASTRVTFRFHPDAHVEVFAEVAGLHPSDLRDIPVEQHRLGAPIYEVTVQEADALSRAG